MDDESTPRAPGEPPGPDRPPSIADGASRPQPAPPDEAPASDPELALISVPGGGGGGDEPPGGSIAGEPGGAPVEGEGEGAVMSLVDHLAELRNRIIWSVLAIAVGSVVGFLFGESIIAFLRSPLPTDEPLVVLGIGDAFAIQLRIALVVGVILGMPVILWNVWRFVAPGLTASERRTILPWIPIALLFFGLGVAIAYVVLPYAATFLLSFQTPDIQAMLSAREYFDFVSTMFLAFGLIMEFPILLVGLSRVGIVTSERLQRSRRLVVLGIFIFAAAATPGGDLVSFGVLGLTLYALFEGTIWFIRRSGR